MVRRLELYPGYTRHFRNCSFDSSCAFRLLSRLYCPTSRQHNLLATKLWIDSERFVNQ